MIEKCVLVFLGKAIGRGMGLGDAEREQARQCPLHLTHHRRKEIGFAGTRPTKNGEKQRGATLDEHAGHQEVAVRAGKITARGLHDIERSAVRAIARGQKPTPLTAILEARIARKIGVPSDGQGLLWWESMPAVRAGHLSDQ